MRKVQITGWGMSVPEKVMTNAEIEKLVDTSDEWIKSRSGISERRICGDEESVATMAIEAGKRAIERARIDPAEIDLVILATLTDARLLPSTAAYVQEGVGARRAGAFDLDCACTGFIAGLGVAAQFIATGAMQKILVIGADAVSRILDWTDRGTCVLFGDGAGAVVVEAGDEGIPLSLYLRNDGSAANALTVPSPMGVRSELPANREFVITMDGPAIFRFAVEAMVDAAREVCDRSGIALDDFDLVIPHQANLRIIQAAARALKVPMDKVYTNVERYGNTSGGSIPLALAEAVDAGRIKKGDRILLVGFGAGMSWGALTLEWTAETASARLSEIPLAAATA
ncbi:MAG: beta-ketoacyl-ACP synthase III [Dehalococcoidia bacterium]|nr:beta-ketoacyl-ACP synthase III [Dehalococcoidia bacterium]